MISFCAILLQFTPWILQVIAKITRDVPAMKLDEPGTLTVKHRRNRPSANDLPADIKAHCGDKFCPLWRNFLGSLTDPWDTDNPSIQSEMQVCFDAIYPGNTYGNIEHGDVVYCVVRCLPPLRNITHCWDDQAMQRFYEWRGKFAQKAVSAVAAFFEAENVLSKSAEDQKWRANYAEWALGPGLPFIYANENPKVRFSSA